MMIRAEAQRVEETVLKAKAIEAQRAESVEQRAVSGERGAGIGNLMVLIDQRGNHIHQIDRKGNHIIRIGQQEAMSVERGAEIGNRIHRIDRRENHIHQIDQKEAMSVELGVEIGSHIRLIDRKENRIHQINQKENRVLVEHQRLNQVRLISST